MAVFIGWTLVALIIWIALGKDAVVQYLSVVFIGGIAIGFGLDRLAKNEKILKMYYKLFPKKVWKIYKNEAISKTSIWADIKRGDINDEIDYKDVISILGVEDLVSVIQEKYKDEKIRHRKSDAEFSNLINSEKNKDK